MENETKLIFISKELDDQLKRRVDVLVRQYLAIHRKQFIANYIKTNFSKFMGEDRPLTSKEVMDMLQISRATLNRRIKSKVIRPINPNEKVHRFLRSEIVECISSRKSDRKE